jgi:DNA-directed RNA polymerase subunit RPC12/RpoP
MVTVEVARCYACGKELPVDRFSRDRSKGSGRACICRPCDAEKGRRYYEANRERVLARHDPAPPREAVCGGCGERFMAKGRQRYCKPACRPTGDRGSKVSVECAWCGREFEARARDRARGGGRFCCKSHALQARNSPAVAA